jgi:hypothetical protein
VIVRVLSPLLQSLVGQQDMMAIMRSWYKMSRLAGIMVVRTWVIADGWLQVGRCVRTDAMV